MSEDFKFFYVGAVEEEGSLDADAVADFAEGDVFGDSTVFDGDGKTFEDLNSFFAAFADFHVGSDGISGLNDREVTFQVGFSNAGENRLLRHSFVVSFLA